MLELVKHGASVWLQLLTHTGPAFLGKLPLIKRWLMCSITYWTIHFNFVLLYEAKENFSKLYNPQESTNTQTNPDQAWQHHP